MDDRITASEIGEKIATHLGLTDRDDRERLVHRVRYIAKAEHLVPSGEPLDRRGTLAFEPIETARAALILATADLGVDPKVAAHLIRTAGSGVFPPHPRGALCEAVEAVARGETPRFSVALRRDRQLGAAFRFDEPDALVEHTLDLAVGKPIAVLSIDLRAIWQDLL